MLSGIISLGALIAGCAWALFGAEDWKFARAYCFREHARIHVWAVAAWLNLYPDLAELFFGNVYQCVFETVIFDLSFMTIKCASGISSMKEA